MDHVSEARAALRQGDKSTARTLITDALRENPRDPAAWLLMSGVVDSPDQQRDCLRRVLALDPANDAAQLGLAVLEAAPPAAPGQPSADVAPSFQSAQTASGSPAPAWQPPATLPPPAYAAPSAAQAAPASSAPAPSALPAAPTPASGSPASGHPSFATRALPTQSLGDAQQAPGPWLADPTAPPPAGSPQAPTYATPLIDYGAYGPPPMSGYGATPVSAYAPPAGAYGSGYVGAPVKRRSPLTTIVIALLSVALLGICMVTGLSMLGREVGPPPPTPNISAQDRTTAMLNDLFALMLNPRFLDPNTMEEAAKPLERYVSSRQRDRFTADLRVGFMSSDTEDIETLKAVTPIMQRMNVEKMTYQVVEQTDRKISLRITGGNIVAVAKDGRWDRMPIQSMFSGVWTYVNEDGVWYLDDLEVLN